MSFTLEQILENEQKLEEADLKKSAYSKRVQSTRRFVLELAEELEHPLTNWGTSMVMHALKAWIDDENRDKCVSNKVINEVKSRILTVLAEEGNTLSTADLNLLKARINQLAKRRCLTGTNPIIKKAMIIKCIKKNQNATSSSNHIMLKKKNQVVVNQNF